MSDKVPWQSRILGAVLVILAVAGGAHLAWIFLRPLLPSLIVIAALLGIYVLVVMRRHF